MEMKKLLNIISEGKQITENCGGMMNSATSIPGAPSTPPVSMSVNLNAQGIDQIKDLLNLMNKADSPLAPGVLGQSPAPMPMPTPADVPPMISQPMLTPKAEPMGTAPEGPKAPDMRDLIKIASAPDTEPDDQEMEPGEKPAAKKEMQAVAGEVKGLADELKNSPAGTSMDKPTTFGMDAAVPSGDDLHKQKGAYPKVNGGDNPMALEQLKSQLLALYKEIKEDR
jgi:hypothetical protein